MITTRELARLVVAGALAATLAGCTDSGESPDDPAAPTTSSAGSESSTEDPVEESASEAGPFVDVPPADEIATAFTVPVPDTGSAAIGMAMLGPVFTDDLIVFTDDRDFLHAIDRATGQERWR